MRKGDSVVIINLDIPKNGTYKIETINRLDENDADIEIKKYCAENNEYDRAIVGPDDIELFSN